MMLLFAKDPCPLHNRVRCERCRCPLCKRGIVLEDSIGDFCSRRYYGRPPCDGPMSNPMTVARSKIRRAMPAP